MRVFVTGATGFIGSAVVQELIKAGHQPIGLARNDDAVQSLAAAGAAAHPGDLEDLDSLRRGAAACDAVIHTAFVHDFSRYKDAGAIDRRAVEAIGAALAGSNRSFVVTSGTAVLPSGRLATETDAPDERAVGAVRIASERATLELASKGVRAMVLRLPPTVHGDGDHGFVPLLINIAREKGAAAYIGDGENRWAAVHRFDAARLFRLALENGEAAVAYHGVAEEAVAFREIAAVIGKRLNVPIVGKRAEEAADYFGWFAGFAQIDNPTSSRLTQEQLGWRPVHSALIADLDRASYFDN